MWVHLLQQALTSLPAQLAALDPQTEAAFKRFAGRRLCLELPSPRRHIVSENNPSSNNSSGGMHLLVEFAPDGTPALQLADSSSECDFSLRLYPRRWRGNRMLALRLLVTVRRYRPDWEEAVELWMGSTFAGQVAIVAEALTDTLHRQRAAP